MKNDDDWRGLHANEASGSLPIDQVVTQLRDQLGIRLVAYIGRVSTTATATAWATGRDVPDVENATRLRTAFRALGILLQLWDPVTIQSWFKGMNPLLNDVSPARFIRESAPDAASVVVDAARSEMIN
ncbi:hypothetical protein [Leifsonia poae]|uniref:hypothetical protein n=1 Tax=Leifsonia poae TaxID=110933 RepID=UPI001CBF1AAF|nr:hypothetical protein [Leifsonia poae]